MIFNPGQNTTYKKQERSIYHTHKHVHAQNVEYTQKLIDSLTHNTTVKELWLPEKYKSSIDSSRVLFTHGVTLYN